MLAAAAFVLLVTSSRAHDDLETIDKLIGDYSPSFEVTKTFDVAARSQTRQIFQQIKKHIREGHWLLATERLQTILDRWPNHVVAIDPELYRVMSARGDELLLYQGAGDLAHRVLGLLPEEGMKAYRERFDEPAARQLEAGTAARSLGTLRSLAERYYWTRSGLPGLLLLGTLYQERGDHAAASWYLSQAVTYPRVVAGHEGLQAVATVRAALSLRALGRDEDLVRLRELHQSSEIRAGDRTRALSEAIVEIVQDLRPRSPRTPRSSRLADWPQMAGTNDGSSLMAPPSSTRALQWATRIETNPFKEEPRSTMPIDKEQIALPFYPIISNGSVLLNDSVSLRSFDLYTGELRWNFRSRLGQELLDNRGTDDLEGLNPNAVFSATAHEGRVFANLQVRSSRRRSQSFHGMPIQIPLPERKLFAFDEESGKLLWSHAEPPFSRDPFIAMLNEPTPPVIFENLAITSVWFEKGKFHALVCAFDVDTGELVWRTPIATGQLELNMFGRPFMEFSPGVVSEQDGIAYFCTNLGVVAALDARAGWIRWIREYEPIEIYAPSGMAPEPRQTFWANSPPVVAEGKLFFAPTDATDVYCLDVRNGHTLWRQPYDVPRRSYRQRQLRHHLMGVADGKVYLSGSALTIRDTATGDEIIQASLSDASGAMSTSRGAITREGVFLRKGQVLLRFDLDGRRLESIPLESGVISGAILASGGGALVAATRQRIETYLDWDRILEIKREEIERLPRGSAERFVALGDLEISRRDYDGAIDQFRRALEALPVNARDAFDERYRQARSGLFRTYRELGRQARDSRAAAEFFAEAELYAPNEELGIRTRFLYIEALSVRAQSYPDKYENALKSLLDEYGDRLESLEGPGQPPTRVGVRALRMRIAHRLRRENWPGAIEDAQQLIARYADDVDRGRPVDDIARESIREILEASPTEVRARYEQRARTVLESVRRSDSPEQFQQALAQFPGSRTAEDYYLELARLYLERDDHAAALRVVRDFISKYPESARRPQVYLQQAAVAEAEGNHSLVRGLAELVRTRYSSATGDGESTAGQLAEQLLERLPAGTDTVDEPRHPAGWKGELERRWDIELGSSGDSYLVRPRGDRPESARDLLFAWVEDKNLIAVDLSTRETLWRRTLDGLKIVQSHLEPIFVSGRLVAVDTADVVAFDPRTNAEHWRVKFAGDVRNRVVAWGIVFVHVEDLDLPGRNRIAAIDAVSGEQLWAFTLRDQIGSLLPGAERLLVEIHDRERLAVVDPFTGVIEYERDLPEGRDFSDAWTVGDRLYLPVMRPKELRCIDLASRRELWTRTVPRSVPCQFLPNNGRPLILLDSQAGNTSRTTLQALVLEPTTGAVLDEKTFAFGGDRVRRQDAPPGTIVLKNSELTDQVGVYRLIIVGLELETLSAPWSYETTWSANTTEERKPFPSLQSVRASREHAVLCFNLTPPQRTAETSVQIEILDRRSGQRLQSLELTDAPESDGDIHLEDGRLFVLKGTQLICFESKR